MVPLEGGGQFSLSLVRNPPAAAGMLEVGAGAGLKGELRAGLKEELGAGLKGVLRPQPLSVLLLPFVPNEEINEFTLHPYLNALPY